jgi:hypothetical protein
MMEFATSVPAEENSAEICSLTANSGVAPATPITEIALVHAPEDIAYVRSKCTRERTHQPLALLWMP